MLRVRCIINSFGVYIIPLGALISQVVSCTTSKSTKVAKQQKAVESCCEGFEGFESFNGS